ncbi:hypothetical protein TNCT_682431, partial [Trichonephila clavata]
HPFHLSQLERGSERHVPVLDRSRSLAVAGLHHPSGCQPLLSAGSYHHCACYTIIVYTIWTKSRLMSYPKLSKSSIADSKKSKI